jgi:hypothetical protein
MASPSIFRGKRRLRQSLASVSSTSGLLARICMPPPPDKIFFSGLAWSGSVAAGAGAGEGAAETDAVLERPKMRVLTSSAKWLMWPITSPWFWPVSLKVTSRLAVEASRKRASVLMLLPKTVRLPKAT